MNNSIDTVREEEIIKARENNATYNELAKKYGISRSRVAQICKRRKEADLIAKEPDDSIMKTDLDTRVKTILRHAGILTIGDLKEYLSDPYELRHLGPGGLAECWRIVNTERYAEELKKHIETVSRYLDYNTMSEDEVCDYLNLDQAQLDEIVNAGSLHTKKYGKAQIFYRKEVAMYKDSHFKSNK